VESWEIIFSFGSLLEPIRIKKVDLFLELFVDLNEMFPAADGN
jgi:hypothetical protein